ncbi:MAG: class E sortase [Actinomycetaceae bacterium]|nr:class E sortase [Actinomycetaceae bacterium]
MAVGRVAGHIRRETPARGFWYGFIGVIGELCITAAGVLALFAFWQVYWTSFEVEAPRQEKITAFEKENAPTKNQGVEEFSEPPPFAIDTPDGEIYGLLHFPTWDWMKTPLAQGTTDYVLDQGFAGHYDETAQPGGVGNFSVAGHRLTQGNNFQRVEELKEGDPVVVNLKDYYLTYRVVRTQIVAADDPDNIRVIAPVIDDISFNKTPTERWMTMTTCHPMWNNHERFIVHLKYESWTPKDKGVPPALVDQPAS